LAKSLSRSGSRKCCAPPCPCPARALAFTQARSHTRFKIGKMSEVNDTVDGTNEASVRAALPLAALPPPGIRH